MPITIEIQQGGGTTDHWMLAATIGLFFASGAQAIVAMYQAKVAKRQAEAADRQAEAARKAIITNIMTADDAAMPMLHIWYAGEASLGYIDLNAKNIGTGMAFNFALGHGVHEHHGLHEHFVKSDDLSAFYLPARVLAPTEQIPFKIEKRALLSEGGVVLRYESAQRSQIFERLSITEANILSVVRLRLYRPYVAQFKAADSRP
jgi:hypothetical protein